MVHRGRDRRLGCRAAHHARRPTALLRPCDHHGADLARCVPPRTAPDRRADRIHHTPAGARSRRARPFDIEPASRNIARRATGIEQRARASACRQHWAAAVRSWRVVGREAWRADAPILEEAASRRGRRHRRDRGSRVDLQWVGPLLDQVGRPRPSIQWTSSSSRPGSTPWPVRCCG